MAPKRSQWNPTFFFEVQKKVKIRMKNSQVIEVPFKNVMLE